VERIPVSSSSLSSIGYDVDSQTLEVEFNHGGVYQYAGVPEGEYTSLMSSSSLGQYFQANIKNRYPFSKV
jgi:hypothetical protein